MGARPQDRERRRRAKEERRRRRERQRHRDPGQGSAETGRDMPLDAPTWPIAECRVARCWRTPGSLVPVVVARRGPAGEIAAGVFLIDMGCLGAKNGFMTLLDAGGYARARSRIFAGASEACDLALAATIVRGGIQYARSLGFEPHPDAVAALPLLGPEVPEGSQAGGDPRVAFGGSDGRPFYYQGPDDDPDAVVAQLLSRFGPDGFTFTARLTDSALIDAFPAGAVRPVEVDLHG